MRRETGLWLAPSVDPEQGRHWQASFGQWFGPAGQPLPGLDETRFALLEDPLGKLLAKRDAGRSRRSWLVWLGLRPARGLGAWRMGLALCAAGLPTPEPLAYLQHRGAPPQTDGVLITRFIEALDPLSFLEWHGHTEQQLQALMEALAVALARLHAAGFRHRDLKAPNLLVKQHSVDAAPQVLFIDLESVRQPGHVGRGMLQRDLARLCASFRTPRAEQLGIEAAHWELLLNTYFNASKLDCKFLPASLRATRAWAAKHNARNLKRQRPLS